MTADEPLVQRGRDETLERQADKLLSESVGANTRSIDRDVEKMRHEAGFASEGLEFYDPANDWDTSDSVFAIFVEPADIAYLKPSICTGIDDGNSRARNPKMQERRALMSRVGDEDGWKSEHEDIPLLGINDGPRKACTKCRKPKGRQYFSPDKRNKDGLSSWCQVCRREAAREAYARKLELQQVRDLGASSDNEG